MPLSDIERLKKTLSHNLRAARDFRQLTQAQLARRAGMPEAQVSHYENGTLPTLTNLKRLCDALDISIDWTVGRSKEMCE